MSFVRATASEIVDMDSNPDPIESTKLILYFGDGQVPVP